MSVTFKGFKPKAKVLGKPAKPVPKPLTDAERAQIEAIRYFFKTRQP